MSDNMEYTLTWDDVLGAACLFVAVPLLWTLACALS